jgi:hypothetical protein
MRWCVAVVASAILFHGVHASAFAGEQVVTPDPAAVAAVAVAIGLAWADRATIELPVTVEIVRPEAEPASPPGTDVPGRGFLSPALVPGRAEGPLEWTRICGPNGCRLVPRLSPPTGTRSSPGEDPDAAVAPSAAGDGGSEGDRYGCDGSARRRLFGRHR